MREMISPEEARDLVLSQVAPLAAEEVSLLEAAGRVAAVDLTSDINVSAFDHAAMDGFAMRAAQLEGATQDSPVELEVIAEVAAGDYFDGQIPEGTCVRIMTGAPLPAAADSVVKYEIVGVVSGDGRLGSRVSFADPTKPGSNVRMAGEEAKAGEVIVKAGEAISTAGVGFLASTGNVNILVHRRPKVAIVATGSELVDPTQVPGPGKIRNSNSYAMAACAQAAGAIPMVLPISEDSFEGLAKTVKEAAAQYDFVVTTGGAANGDFDFIKKVVDELGTLMMTTVNMRPGKAQTFGLVDGTPVFGLPGNPAAAYCGFELLIRPALRKMQGFGRFERPSIQAHISKDMKKKDPRRIYTRCTLSRGEDGSLIATPDKNQSSGSFGSLQRSTVLAIQPEGTGSLAAGDLITCILMDVNEDVPL